MAAGVNSGFPLSLFYLGVGGVVMLPTTVEVHKGGRHCGDYWHSLSQWGCRGLRVVLGVTEAPALCH